MVDFPTLSMRPDGLSFKVSIPNAAIESDETDGGYYSTRPRYTRRPPKTFRFKFTDIGQADRDVLDTFFSTTVKGSSLIFNFTDPTNGTVHQVRFSKGFQLEFVRTGVASNHRYDTNEISLTEV
jgi:hypothetical protein